MSAGPSLHAPIYGVSCERCGAMMVRGPSDGRLCSDCFQDEEHQR